MGSNARLTVFTGTRFAIGGIVIAILSLLVQLWIIYRFAFSIAQTAILIGLNIGTLLLIAGYGWSAWKIINRAARKQDVKVWLESSEFSHQVITSVHEGIAVFDRELRYLAFTPFLERLTGWRAENVIGKKVTEVATQEEVVEVSGQLNRALQGEIVDSGDRFVGASKDHPDLWLKSRVVPLRHQDGEIVGAIMTVNDMTERKRVEAALRERELSYRDLFQANPHSMWVFDRLTLKFLAVNDAAVARYGYTAEEFLDMTIKDIRPPEDVPTLLDTVARTSDGIAEVGVWRHRTKDGRSLLVEISSHELDFSGRPAKVVLAHDVTEQQTAQAKITELNATLERRIEERTKELALKSKELESFCYSVSHDLKAPLRGIDGYSRLLLEGYLDKIDNDGKKFLQNICSATLQMTQLIDDLLTYSRQERRLLVKLSINLQRFVTEQLERSRADLANVELDVSVQAVEVLADYDSLLIALRNLLDNAVKFSGNSIRPAISIRSQVLDQVCVLAIQDNGVGFDMRFYDRIFEVFQRLHRAEDFPGTGIGLAMVRKAMERIGGRVWAESQPGHGATFYLEIPLVPQAILSAPRVSAEKH